MVAAKIVSMASREPAALAAASRGKDFYGALGRAIKVIRAEQGVERKELARLSGLSYPYVSEIEKGEKRASTEALLAIAQALRLRQSELVERAERLLERAQSRSGPSGAARRRPGPAALARVYRLQPAAADSASKAGLQELVSRAGQLGPDDFNRVLDLVRRLAR